MRELKWMIASDLHGSAHWCRKLLEQLETEQADRLLLLGDLLYHGPRNDLPKEYDPKQVFGMLNERKDRILAVRGNCDSEVDQMVLEFPMLADYGVLPVGKNLVYATHGHVYNMENPLPMSKGDVLLFGHIHVPKFAAMKGTFYLNPGSVSLPKEDTPHSYMTLEGNHFRWKDVSTGEPFMEWKME